ncbi:MAG: hypothetical protein LBL08_02470 [Candidatus Nomurabacteria bacterium]|jgi:hypothetical protein|nr:hypothetical protein [Candidatus Nomurabacteria bacterium]
MDGFKLDDKEMKAEQKAKVESSKALSDEERVEKLRQILDKGEQKNSKLKKAKKAKKSSSSLTAKIIVGVVILGLVGFGAWQYMENVNLRSPDGQKAIAEQETNDLVSKVSALIKLPDETPTIATVSDKEKLKDQPFFADADNGDKVLIFAESSQAIIYRESDNRIINSGPIAISADEGGDEQTKDATE